jgi:hypothetical protein
MPVEWRHLFCPHCGMYASDLELFWWQSPAWTWEALCGRGGRVLWCDSCAAVVRFRLQLLN